MLAHSRDSMTCPLGSVSNTCPPPNLSHLSSTCCCTMTPGHVLKAASVSESRSRQNLPVWQWRKPGLQRSQVRAHGRRYRSQDVFFFLLSQAEVKSLIWIKCWVMFPVTKLYIADERLHRLRCDPTCVLSSGTWWHVSLCLWMGPCCFLGHTMRRFDSGTLTANRAFVASLTKVTHPLPFSVTMSATW